jgi:hypothetical protein
MRELIPAESAWPLRDLVTFPPTAARLQCYNIAILQCYSAVELQNCYVLVLQNYRVAVAILSFCSVAILKCYVVVLQYCNVCSGSQLQCYSTVVLQVRLILQFNPDVEALQCCNVAVYGLGI